MDHFYLNGTKILYADVPKMVQQQQTKISSALVFINQWLSGVQDFEFKTSGSTGPSKNIQVQRNQIELSAKNTLGFLGLEQGQKALVCLNAEYVAGKMMIARSLIGSLEMHICDPSENPFAIYDVQFDFTAVVPLQLYKWLGNMQEYSGLQHVKTIIVGGAALGVALEQQCKVLTGRIFETYGMTETLSHVAMREVGTQEAFAPVFEDLLLGQDERNCLKIKGAITQNEWLQTNDIVQLGSDNNFVINGRADFVINTGGVKVSPEAIERQIKLHLQLENEFVISSMPDDQLGEKLVLVIEAELSAINFSNFDFLPKYMKPKKLVCLPEFPKTNSGKIDRKQIKKKLISIK